MSKESEIKQAIRRIAGASDARTLLVAQVKATDGDTCTIDFQGLELVDVRLSATTDGASGSGGASSKLLITPKVGSQVLVADLSGGLLRDLVVVGFNELESLSLQADQVQLNGGSNGGLVNISDLKDWMQKVVSDLSSLRTLLLSSPIAGNGAPAAIQFSPKTTSVPDMEDTSVTH